MTEQPARHRRLLYGRRKGPKLSAHQARLLEILLPRLRPALEPGRDPRSYFSTPPEGVWLEVGFGAGEHLLEQARAHPDIGMIGAEPYVAGVAKLLAKIESENLQNIRIHEGDAREIIEALPDESLGRVFILFPDPWPKTRHHKRRFIQMDLLDLLARVMKPGAQLRFATDDKSYLPWALERLAAHPAFEWTAQTASDWRVRPPDWPPTRYEVKAIRGAPTYLCFRRLDRI